MNVKECVIFDSFFKAPEEFEEFYRQRGYTGIEMYLYGKMNFDPEIVQYVKDHADWHAYGETKYAMKGAPSYDFKIGFAGTATVIEVDIDRKWMIRYSHCDTPYPVYVEEKTNEYNYTYYQIVRG